MLEIDENAEHLSALLLRLMALRNDHIRSASAEKCIARTVPAPCEVDYSRYWSSLFGAEPKDC